MLPVPRTDGRLVLLEAEADGVVVGSARLWFFLHDNTHLVEAGVWVAPQPAARASAARCSAEVEARTRADGRTTVIGSAFAPVDAESPGSLFAAAMGYPVGSHEETKVVDLKTAPSGWGALEDEVAARARRLPRRGVRGAPARRVPARLLCTAVRVPRARSRPGTSTCARPRGPRSGCGRTRSGPSRPAAAR